MVAIKEIRKKRNITQAELAAMIHKTPAAVSRYETGDRKLDLDTAARIARALRCTVEDLLTEKTG